MTRTFGLGAAIAFIASIVLANYVTTEYGMVAIGLGLTATAGTYLAGMALGLRDIVHDTLGRLGMFGVIAIGASVSYAVSDPHIATASAVAVLLSELADFAVYSPLKRSGRKPLGVLLSNTVGAFFDTVIFLSLAGFFAWGSVGGQLVGKVAWATLVPLGLVYALRSLRKPAQA